MEAFGSHERAFTPDEKEHVIDSEYDRSLE